MRVLIAGATGVIGRPLAKRLRAEGHEVHGIGRDGSRVTALEEAGIRGHEADVFDRDAVVRATAAAQPEVVIDQLTALPAALDVRKYRAAMADTTRLRGTPAANLVHAAREAGARRVILQSISFVTAPEGPDVHDEDAPLYLDAPAQFRDTVESVARMEAGALEVPEADPVVLRYGFFYGRGTWYSADGANGHLIAKRQFPLVGDGGGISSFVHIDDAVAGTAAALEGGASGIYNVTDDEPARASEWIPFAAEQLGAKPPRRVPKLLARGLAGGHAVHFATTMRGNANARFKETFGWEPANPSWRPGFERAFRRDSRA